MVETDPEHPDYRPWETEQLELEAEWSEDEELDPSPDDGAEI